MVGALFLLCSFPVALKLLFTLASVAIFGVLSLKDGGRGGGQSEPELGLNSDDPGPVSLKIFSKYFSSRAEL